MSSGRLYLPRLYRPSRRRFSSFHPLLYSPDDIRPGSNPSDEPADRSVANASAVEEEPISFGKHDSISVRRYRPPNAIPHQHILYLPPPTHPKFPRRDLLSAEFVAPIIAIASSTAVIVPEPPAEPAEPLRFPANLHTLLAIHDYFCAATDNSQPTFRTGLLSAGLSTPLAAAIAASEWQERSTIHAQGIWCGVLDLTEHIEGVAYSPSERKWKFYNPPTPALQEPEYRLGMSVAELTLQRMRMFPKPEMWTDPFASPMHRFIHCSVSFDPAGPAPPPWNMYFPNSYRRRRPIYISGTGEGVELPAARVVVPPEGEPDEVGLAHMGSQFVHGTRRFYQNRWLEIAGRLISGGPDSEAAIEAKNQFLEDRFQLREASANEWEAEVRAMGSWLGRVLQGPR